MSMDRAYLNWEGGHTVCCWNAPSVEALEKLFKDAETPFERMFSVEEHASEALVEG
jgi:hypothetical protein